jgi:hypothetical protein
MKNNKTQAIWSRNVKKFKRGDILNLRRSLSIPDEGFDTSEDRDVWEDEAKIEFAKFGEITDFTEKAQNYEKIIKSKLYLKEKARKEIVIHSPELKDFGPIIDHYLFFDYVPEWMLGMVNSTGCRFDFVIEKSPNLEKGLYIKISENTSINDVKDFLLGKAKDLIWYKKLVYGTKGKRIKSPKEKQNNVTYFLNTYDLDDLITIYKALSKNKDDIFVFTRKDMVVARIMKELGYKVTPEGVRQIVSREKKKRSV